MAALWLSIGAVVGASAVYLVLRVRVMSAEPLIATLQGECEQLRSERETALRDTTALREELGDAREAAARDVAEVHQAAARETALVREQLGGVQTELATAQTELRK